MEPTGALAGYIHLKRTARRLRRAAEDGRLEQAAPFAAASPRWASAPLALAIFLPLALLAMIGLGGTLLGWAAPSSTARAVETVRGLLGALGIPGETPWLPAARGMTAYWAEQGAADRGVVFAAAADASAVLSLALVPLMVVPFWASSAHRGFASLIPPDPEILRRGRLFGAGMAAFCVALVWYGARLLIYGDLDAEGRRRAVSAHPPLRR